MAHVRKAIIAALAVRVTGLTTTGANVFTQRKYPADEERLPCHLIYRGDEISEPAEMGRSPREMTRVFEAMVETIASGEGADDQLDDAAAEVEAALASDRTLGGLVRDAFVTRWQPGPVLDDTGRKRMSSARVVVRITYFTTDSDPGTAV